MATAEDEAEKESAEKNSVLKPDAIYIVLDGESILIESEVDVQEISSLQISDSIAQLITT
ncbi:MAG: hypothetical protein HRU43_07025, partial [Simkaniaceae bacterium]|nr:hypothetical protein [Simkaniaceae bacterium]